LATTLDLAFGAGYNTSFCGWATTLNHSCGVSLGDHTLLLKHDDPGAIPLLFAIFL